MIEKIKTYAANTLKLAGITLLAALVANMGITTFGYALQGISYGLLQAVAMAAPAYATAWQTQIASTFVANTILTSAFNLFNQRRFYRATSEINHKQKEYENELAYVRKISPHAAPQIERIVETQQRTPLAAQKQQPALLINHPLYNEISNLKYKINASKYSMRRHIDFNRRTYSPWSATETNVGIALAFGATALFNPSILLDANIRSKIAAGALIFTHIGRSVQKRLKIEQECAVNVKPVAYRPTVCVR